MRFDNSRESSNVEDRRGGGGGGLPVGGRGIGIGTIVLALCLTGWLGMARFIRNQIVIIRDRDYNLASRCLGTPTRRIIMKNLLPYLVIGLSTPYKTIPVAIQMMAGSYGDNDMGAMMAMLVLAIIPIVVFYLFSQKYIIEGVAAGAVKG